MNEPWFKSSYSSEAGGNCVEVAHLTPTHIALRDSKQAQGPALLMPATFFAAFVEHVKSERL